MAIYSKFLQLLNGSDRGVDLSTNTLSLGGMQLNGATSGAITHQSSAITTPYTVTWPAAQGTSGQVLTDSDGSGTLTWTTPSGTGANTSLSNLTTTSINEDLLPGTTLTRVLGSNSLVWNALWSKEILYPSFLDIRLDQEKIYNHTGSTSIDVGNTQLNDNSSALSVDWTNRLLSDGTNTQLSWSSSGVEFNQLTVSTVPYLNASRILTSSAVTPTELGYVSGVTSTIQTQLNAKLNLSGGTMSGAINMGGNQINNLANGVAGSDAATYGQILALVAGVSWKDAVLVATTANITLSGEQTIDGFLTSSSRVLVKNQTTQSQNGIYVSGSGAWTRSTDMNSWTQVPGTIVVAQEGTVNADLAFICTSAPGGTLGTTAIVFGPFGLYLADGTTLTLTGNVFSITAGGVGTTQLAAASVTIAKLATITDGTTLDQSGAGGALEIKAAGVSATQLSTGAFDQVTIVGGAGTAASVVGTVALKRTLIAGQAFAANTSYAVRWGLTANSETSNRIYACDTSTSSFDLFYCIGMASSGTTVLAGDSITVTTMGSFTLSSSDTAFASDTDGLPVFIGNSGAFTITAPTSSGTAVTRIGVIAQRSATNTSCIIDVFPAPVGVN